MQRRLVALQTLYKQPELMTLTFCRQEKGSAYSHVFFRDPFSEGGFILPCQISATKNSFRELVNSVSLDCNTCYCSKCVADGFQRLSDGFSEYPSLRTPRLGLTGQADQHLTWSQCKPHNDSNYHIPATHTGSWSTVRGGGPQARAGAEGLMCSWWRHCLHLVLLLCCWWSSVIKIPNKMELNSSQSWT